MYCFLKVHLQKGPVSSSCNNVILLFRSALWKVEMDDQPDFEICNLQRQNSRISQQLTCYDTLVCSLVNKSQCPSQPTHATNIYNLLLLRFHPLLCLICEMQPDIVGHRIHSLGSHLMMTRDSIRQFQSHRDIKHRITCN